MEKSTAIKSIAILIVISSLLAISFYTPVYHEIKSSIVSTLCLSCIKLDPRTTFNFTFKTANNQSHPKFVLENLTIGPVFLEYRLDACSACDAIEPVVKEIFKLNYTKEEDIREEVDFNGTKVVFFHINLDHAPQYKKESFDIYDIRDANGVPMITIVTLNLNRTSLTVKPYFFTGYGFWGESKAEDAKPIILKLIRDAINVYNSNKAGYSIS